MKRFFLMVWSAGISCGWAEVDFPSNPLVGPKRSTSRPVGGTVEPGARPASEAAGDGLVSYVTHIVLSDVRMWTSADGKPLAAKLIAFEDLKVSGKMGDAEPAMPAPPEHPTVIRDGKVRLLVAKKAVEVPLDRLSEQDKEFVENLRLALAAKPAQGG